ncbi:MAG: tRNA (adenosine(37)-N6)-threonylcarbamoyltransferase complex ATPase subunit type 1 TsaE, partial [Synechococcus sp. cluster2_bin.44]|nr:tRNA (adenosine(37)-N6)-threonylcarbamoyltransferase complex ATPase subunit type 1 TsaE [Synechococcus sp. cluster2_bin.44]
DEEARAIGALLAVEWPERLSLSLPEAWLLQLSHTNDGCRSAQLTPPRNVST